MKTIEIWNKKMVLWGKLHKIYVTFYMHQTGEYRVRLWGVWHFGCWVGIIFCFLSDCLLDFWAVYTLKRNSMISPSWTTYSFPSRRSKPFSLHAWKLPRSRSFSYGTTSALINPFSMSECSTRAVSDWPRPWDKVCRPERDPFHPASPPPCR